MKNRFGEKLDRNGYAESIVGDGERCFLCGRSDKTLHRHEVYHGSNRTKSKNLGLWVCLCVSCHDELHHRNSEKDHYLKVYMQKRAMGRFGWTVDDFIREFGKNYI